MTLTTLQHGINFHWKHSAFWLNALFPNAFVRGADAGCLHEYELVLPLVGGNSPRFTWAPVRPVWVMAGTHPVLWLPSRPAARPAAAEFDPTLMGILCVPVVFLVSAPQCAPTRRTGGKTLGVLRTSGPVHQGDGKTPTSFGVKLWKTRPRPPFSGRVFPH